MCQLNCGSKSAQTCFQWIVHNPIILNFFLCTTYSISPRLRSSFNPLHRLHLLLWYSLLADIPAMRRYRCIAFRMKTDKLCFRRRKYELFCKGQSKECVFFTVHFCQWMTSTAKMPSTSRKNRYGSGKIPVAWRQKYFGNRKNTDCIMTKIYRKKKSTICTMTKVFRKWKNTICTMTKVFRKKKNTICMTTKVFRK